MRSAVLLLVLVGCTDDSPSDRVKELSSHATSCGQITRNCNPLTSPDDAVLCLNDALDHGQVAYVTWMLFDTAGFSRDTWLFAVDHHVEEYTSSPDDHGGDSTWTKSPNCAGPFEPHPERACPSAQVIALGCP